MKSRWDQRHAASLQGGLALRVYSSQLLGQDPALVMYGGGNTSVKLVERDLFARERTLLYVKGSGSDLHSITAEGFAPLELERVRELATLDRLSDPDMMRELKACAVDPAAPAPSVETILHAIIPYDYVDHTHATAVLAVTNSDDGGQRIREIYGDSVVVVPYVMPGFDLAKQCAQAFADQAGEQTEGMVLLQHGIFSFADSAQESYERMIALVSRAEEYLKKNRAWFFTAADTSAAEQISATDPLQVARLRADLCRVADTALILSACHSSKARDFIARPDCARLSQQGPVTPDHVIRTKRLPMLGRDLEAYVEAYTDYFKRHSTDGEKIMLDPAPRVILDPQLGLYTAGRTAADAVAVRDIYLSSIDVILSAEALGGYRALPAADIFDVEYWDLEQAKLKRAGPPKLFSGEVVLISGAASGIGRACVDAFLERGAAVVAVDKDTAVSGLYQRADYLGLVCDLSDEQAVAQMIGRAVQGFGGIDMLVLNAGVFPASARIESLDTAEWNRVIEINLTATMFLLRAAIPFLKLAFHGGRVSVIGSKNVAAPGPGAVAYSASKAAVNQLIRVAALELAADGIRLNSLHPDAVFDTGLWTPQLLAERAANYGISVEEYKKKNLLRTELCSADVAELAAELCGPLFAKTTAAQIPVDGGNLRVI